MTTKLYVPRDFFARRMVLFQDWVSNGYFSIHRSRIVNAGDFASAQRASRWMPEDEDEEGDFVHDFDIRCSRDNKGMNSVFQKLEKGVSPFLITEERLFHGLRDRAVVLAGIVEEKEVTTFMAEPYVDALGLRPGGYLYGRGEQEPFMDTPERETATIVIMPLNPKGILEESKKFNQETGERVLVPEGEPLEKDA